jgi:hypothetical protein
MILVTAAGLDYWVWRSSDRSRDRALGLITWGLGLSGLGLVAAVAQRFGVEPQSLTDIGSLLSSDDNRAVMIPADLLGVFGATLMMAWGFDFAKSPAERLGERIAATKAKIEALNAKTQRVKDRVLRRGIRTLLAAYRKVV